MDNRLNKLSIITPWYGEFAGGAEVAARGYAEALVRCGIEVEVLTTCCKSPYDNWWFDSLKPGVTKKNEVIIRRFPVNKKGRELYEQAVIKQLNGKEPNLEEQYNFFSYGINSNSLIDYVKTIPHGQPIIALPYFQSLIFSVVTQLQGRVILMPCFHDEPQFYWEPIRDMLTQAKGVIYLSEEEKDLTIKTYGIIVGRKVIEAIVAGVGVENIYYNRLSPMGDSINDLRATLLAKYDLPSEYFLYIGRKEAGKGVVELVQWYKAYIKCQKEKGYIPLVFIGGGDASLVPQDEWFIDLGFVNERDKYALMRSALAIINLSRNESFSLVVMESWLSGTPVIVSSSCTVTYGHCLRSNGGMAVSNVEDFCLTLDLIANRPEIRVKMGEQGYNYVCKNYDWESVIARLALSLRESYGGNE